MPSVAPLATTAVALDATRASAGRVELAPVVDERAGHTVWLVTPDADAAAYYMAGRGVHRAGAVVGGIVREGGRWSVTAYADRAHLIDAAAGGPVWFLPDARNRAAAARSLLRWWWYVDQAAADGVNVGTLNPFDLSAADRRALLG